MYKSIVTHVLPSSLTYVYSIGFTLILLYVFQIISGVLLAANFSVSLVALPFAPLNSIQYGYLTRSLHIANVTSIFFLMLIHFWKYLAYSIASTTSAVTLLLGIAIYGLTVVIAFFGYCLTSTSLSFWGIMIAANLINAVPFIGSSLLKWLFSGEFITITTLSKLYVIHIALPIGTCIVLVMHIVSLHLAISSDPFSKGLSLTRILFSGSAFNQDLVLLTFFLSLSSYSTLYYWAFVFHEESFELFSSVKTPAKVIPEWYFLYFFGILKSLSSKLGGILTILGCVASILGLQHYTYSQGVSSGKILCLQWACLLFISITCIATLATYVALLWPLAEYILVCVIGHACLLTVKLL